MGDKTRGVYNKFRVYRVDRTDCRGGKHDNCAYFVLDLPHDPYAIPALKAYAEACRRDYPVLASALDERLARMEARHA